MFIQQYSYCIVVSSESSLDLGSNGHKRILVRMASAIIKSPKEAMMSGDCNLEKCMCPSNLTESRRINVTRFADRDFFCRRA